MTVASVVSVTQLVQSSETVVMIMINPVQETLQVFIAIVEFCVGSCGQPYNKTHRCHCNALCKTHKNCCDDYDVFCLLREFHEESTSRPTTSLSKDTGIIAGVTVSLTVVMLIVVVILALVYRKWGLFLAAAVFDDTGNIEGGEDGDTTYVRAISGVYDELNGKDKRKIPTKYQNENESKVDGSKSEIYTLTSNLTVNQQTKDNNSSAKWQTPDAEDFDPTYNHSNNVIVREDLSNYDHFSNQ
ncbi:ENDOU [Mytilus edulis]|uniref:ENDOU n=1 Tax=Mytilus edulis TaxID=6550 RepID=A0A8S3QQR1_MYTED|nr:ENDOU [Mytilus edulis]